MWHYLFMIAHIREKDPNDYNGWEGYVAEKMKHGDLNFFPQLDAISLSKYKAREKAAATRQAEMAESTAKGVASLEALLQTQIFNQEKLMEEVRDLQMRLDEPSASIEKRLDTFMRSIESRLGGLAEASPVTRPSMR